MSRKYIVLYNNAVHTNRYGPGCQIDRVALFLGKAGADVIIHNVDEDGSLYEIDGCFVLGADVATFLGWS